MSNLPIVDKNLIHTIIQSFNHAKGRTLVWLYGCMKFLSIKFTLFIVSSLLLLGCDDAPPIPTEKFLELYIDLLIIQDTTTATNFSLDSVKTLVLNRYNVSLEQYDAMIDYYNSQPDKWIVFFDSATVYAERLRLEAENQP